MDLIKDEFKMKTMIKYLCGILLVASSFLLGFYYARKDITIYQRGKYTEIYPNSWPTYNLPLVEYSCILENLNKGDVTEAKRRLNSFLNKVLEDANDRLPYADEKQKVIIKKAIERAKRNEATIEKDGQ